MFFTASIERLEKQMTGVVRKLAIENQELRKKVSDYEIKLIEENIKIKDSDKTLSKD